MAAELFKNSSNRLSLNYEQEASKFLKLSRPIVDLHSHINGEKAARVYKRAARAYGVGLTYSMTQLEQAAEVRAALGDSIRFIAIPDFNSGDPLRGHGKEYIPRIKQYYELGARIAKFWSAPRLFDSSPDQFRDHPLRLDSPLRLEAMQAAADLGMAFMVHVGDPDTWFATKYKDSAKYGTKLAQYDPLRVVLERFKIPLIAAHMGGYPEDLDFLSELLAAHSNLYLDCSATKWMVRELSKHPREEMLSFFSRWKGRVFFGSDIVTSDAHLNREAKSHEMMRKASSEEEAFDLYASRYWALRTLLESDYAGESPISDPDLNLVDPANFSELDAPKLLGKSLPLEVLEPLYFTAARFS
ncbi:MAG: hypothetical protein DCC75_13500 [Proteobacteria bacterium]|nr:MAG: hypothetical protein DCC75_13500 [Pseudomonadota bacterium]